MYLPLGYPVIICLFENHISFIVAGQAPERPVVSLVKGKDIRLAHQILVPHGLSPRFMPANVIFLTRDHSWPDTIIKTQLCSG